MTPPKKIYVRKGEKGIFCAKSCDDQHIEYIRADKVKQLVETLEWRKVRKGDIFPVTGQDVLVYYSDGKGIGRRIIGEMWVLENYASEVEIIKPTYFAYLPDDPKEALNEFDKE